jgi:hypothetical protein
MEYCFTISSVMHIGAMLAMCFYNCNVDVVRNGVFGYLMMVGNVQRHLNGSDERLIIRITQQFVIWESH